MECPYPDLFSSITNRCERFTTVSCKDRPEHQAPCKSYLRKYFDNSINNGIKYWLISLLFYYYNCISDSVCQAYVSVAL